VISVRACLVGRYDKRLCSYNEITKLVLAGFDPLAFERRWLPVRLCALHRDQLPELFLDYLAGGVDCVLFSSYSEDPVFDVTARGHRGEQLWISVSVAAQYAQTMPAGVIGPHGIRLASLPNQRPARARRVDLDRADPALDMALNKARPWRAIARAAHIYQEYRVGDPRSTNRTSF